eukprot:CAMPEP_0168608158 /NCGR_PEP_ID=MMETSP0449_2-20121227/471_1 /TAXON_ID=1082188 /ORGANISM="Strombidium rassoulzadegani, Strain ras09" /LENGTH=46 /DNA_ID= /DNA_START= /DNA_END= /DNA_ORIENTATION=
MALTKVKSEQQLQMKGDSENEHMEEVQSNADLQRKLQEETIGFEPV